MERYKVVLTPSAKADIDLFGDSDMGKINNLLYELSINPEQYTKSTYKLTGIVADLYSIRLNRKDRLVYQIYKENKIIKVICVKIDIPLKTINLINERDLRLDY